METTEARRRRRWWQRGLAAGLDILFPARCAGCGSPGSEWCPECQSRLTLLQGRLCARCGLPLRSRRACPACRGRDLGLPVRSYARYEGVLIRALLQLKYRPNRRLAEVMGGWLAGVCRREPWLPGLVAPVPLSEERQRQRGYNQANLIAKALAEALQLPLCTDCLCRARETRSQVGLDPVSRFRNVQGAFRAQSGLVRGTAVLLVDDLMTTGATLSACADALREAGAIEVFGVTVGRA